MEENRRQFLKTMGAAAIISTPSLSENVPQSVLNAQTPEALFEVTANTRDSFTIELTIDLKK